MSFSEKIIERRISLNMSQRELAEKLGITPTRLNYWEKGKREPDLHYIKALARELGVSGDYLLETDPEEDASNVVTNIDEHIELYKVLTNRRKELGMKIEDLSRISAVPENTLKKILAGITVNPGITTVKAIVKAMGMTLSELDDQIAVADSLSSDEAKLLRDYRKIDDRSKGFIRYIIDYEVERIQPAQPKPMVNPSEAEIAENAKAAAALDNVAAGD